jgi:hypothetical protein
MPHRFCASTIPGSRSLRFRPLQVAIQKAEQASAAPLYEPRALGLGKLLGGDGHQAGSL